MNHPHMLTMISDRDKDMLNYTINLEVQELGQCRYCCKLMFFFQTNSSFRKEVIVKEYHLSIIGYMASHLTLAQWFWDYEQGSSQLRPGHHQP
ncbi:hypothetical protein Celaphus_00016684 [Cervus elaphus hippelaphus]|uniref:Uncharacterized protein n=1 Tax=Cervus elaphus hippelaphus TaxID=46360 RepID=A0A212C4S0_CEREH|nr:hypothetical protein Celaphus_00016684 [Cervus elaphus hippelaphus]